MLGRKEESQKAYSETIDISRLSDHSAYAKSLAAMGNMPEALLTELQCALHQTEGSCK